MDMMREVEKGIDVCEYVLNNDIQNAKTYKDRYRKDVEILINFNEAYMKDKTKELMLLISAKEQLEEIPKDNLFIMLKTKIYLGIIQRRINKTDKEINRTYAAC